VTPGQAVPRCAAARFLLHSRLSDLSIHGDREPIQWDEMATQAGPGEKAQPSGDRGADLALPEGLEVGLAGGIAVVAVYALHDLFVEGDWLHTPTVLGTLLRSGADAAGMVAANPTAAEPGIAALYHAAHFSAWTVAGFLGAALVRLAERRPEMRFIPVLCAVSLVAFFFALDGEVRATGIGRLHLWAGGLAGAAAAIAVLMWRHPGSMKAPRETPS